MSEIQNGSVAPVVARDELGDQLTEEQILNGWGNLGPVVVRALRRIDALENERARNITALVEDGVAMKRRLDTIEFDLRTLYRNADVETGIRTDIGKRVAELEARTQPPRTTHDAYTELHNRMSALEARLPAPIEVVTPPAPRCPCEDGSLCALVPGSKAHPHPRCAGCNGPVEPERHCYAHPTCYRCLPPPEPLPVRAVAPQNLALPDYILAPAPDYRSELPAEPDDEACYECCTKHGPDENTRCPLSSVYAVPSISNPCGCDEAIELRKQLADLQPQLDSETASYERTIKSEYSKREALDALVVELRNELGAASEELKRTAAALDRERIHRREGNQRSTAALQKVINERDTALSRATKAEREVARLERAHRVTPGY